MKANSTRSILQKDQQYIWHPFTQMQTAGPPVPIVSGKGVYLFDEQGRKYIDGIASWWVNLHGHAHPYLANALYEQARTLEHVIFAGFTHEPAAQLAERIIRKLPNAQAKVFFSDNGSTAVEVAIKLAIQFFYNQGQKRNKLVALAGAYHGDTFGAMSAGDGGGFNRAFQDYFFEVEHIPVPTPGNERATLDALSSILANGNVYAFIYEPLVQGAAGMRMYAPAVMEDLIALCKKYEVLCIADEVMTGFYRTGKLLASDHVNGQPDLICLSKGLTGGTLPLSITTCTQEIFDAFLSSDHSRTFFHGHSYTANPIGCAAALASLDLLESIDCQEQIRMISQQHLQFVRQHGNHPALADLRSLGTLLAAEFKTAEDSSYFSSIRDELYQFFMDRGILLRPLGNVIYMMPPYCITKQELEQIYEAMVEAMNHYSGRV